MKKLLSLFLVSLILVSVFVIGGVFADSDRDKRDSDNNGNEKEIRERFEKRNGDIRTEYEKKIKNGEIKERIKIKIDDEMEREKRRIEFKKRIKENNGVLEVEGKIIRVNDIGEKRKEIISGKIKAKTDIDLTTDLNETGKGRMLRAILSNGRFANVRIMPDRAAEIALERLRAKCDENNCIVELKEIGEGNKSILAFEINSEKDTRLFFIFKKKMKFKAEVDAETGEIIKIKKPWWAFLAREKNETIEEKELGNENDSLKGIEKVTLCHIPPGNPDAQHTITVGGPAVRAHLAHGDTLGACAEEGNETEIPPGNNTIGNQTGNNTIGNQTIGNITMPGNETGIDINNTNATEPGTNVTINDTNVSV